MKKQKKIFGKQWLPFASVTVALLYIFSLLTTELIHPVLHQHHNHSLHSAADEKDPCHREIYHGEKEDATQHHQHLTPVNEKCGLCDIILHNEHLQADYYHILKPAGTKQAVKIFTDTLSIGFLSLYQARGPPYLV
jgi:hypothetical protein